MPAPPSEQPDAPAPSLPRQRCAACAHELPDTDPATRCPRCGGLLDVALPEPAERGPALARRFGERRRALSGVDASGVWRYRELVHPSAVPSGIVTWPEGNTPLVESARVAAWAGVPALSLKHEGMNPTGSFKDRGMTVGITQARRLGARAVACASTGNTAASLAAYAARADLPALVLIPAGRVALGKLIQSVAYGARTLLVRGDFDDCLRLVRDASEQLGVYLLNSVNPWRVQGQKTIVLELLEQCGWEAPDWIAVPAGNLGNTAAFGAALRDAVALGLIARAPRIAAVQASGAAPFARSFGERFATRYRVTPHTAATAIAIGDPASWDRAVRAIRETRGVVTAVTDDDILEAKAVVDAAGIGCEPASAASVAGVRRLVREGVIGRAERVVAVLTGHVLKDPDAVAHYHRERDPAPAGANRPIEIDATLDAVKRVLA